MSNPELAVDTLKALRYGQAEHEFSNAISDKDEWPHIREAIDNMIKECRD